MSQEACLIFQKVSGLYPYLWDHAFSLYGDCQHILANSFQVNNQNHVILLREARYEFYHNVSFRVLLKASSVILDIKFTLEISSITRYPHYIVDLNI